MRTIGIPGVISLPIGDASNGLCGGMVFAARDFFETERPVPDEDTPPGSGPLFDYLCDRLFDSFDLPWGPTRYLTLMNPVLPDGETVWSRLGIGPHGRAWQTIHDAWPQVRADIDAGHPSPLGLVTVKSSDPWQLKHDHQVLAYGYELDEGILALSVYDPNLPGRDDVRLSLSIADPWHLTVMTMLPSARPVYAFFRVAYEAATPP